MKKTLLFLGFPLVLVAQNGNVGINNPSPAATLDVVTTGSTVATKALRISNSDAKEILTVHNNGNVGINSSISQDNYAQLTVNSGNVNKSVLRLPNLSTSKEKSSSAINYNQISALASDANGNIIRMADVKLNSTTSLTFDGSYSATATAKTLVLLNGGGIVRFQFITPEFSLGNNDVLYADVLWSRNGGFVVKDFGYDNQTGANPMVITGLGTNTLRFDFATGKDLIFRAVLDGPVGANVAMGKIEYLLSETGTSNLELFSTFRTR